MGQARACRGPGAMPIRHNDPLPQDARGDYQMKKESLIVLLLLTISALVTFVLLIKTPWLTCRTDGKCLDPRLLMAVVSLPLFIGVIAYDAIRNPQRRSVNVAFVTALVFLAGLFGGVMALASRWMIVGLANLFTH
jgi:hypothetical protein